LPLKKKKAPPRRYVSAGPLRIKHATGYNNLNARLWRDVTPVFRNRIAARSLPIVRLAKME
jgi:hypothetical protein